MSKDTDHGATTIRASKGGGGGKWIIGAVAAVVVAGGAYAAWKTFGSDGQTNIDSAYSDDYADEYADNDALRARPLESDEDAFADNDAPVAASASAEQRTTTPAPRATASADTIPEETVGITPVNATAVQSDGEDVIVTAPRRPVWARTPTERRLSALYPQRQLERGREGEARLRCIVENNGALDCERIEETPGFGAAALRVSRTFRHATTLADGRDAVGSPVNMRVVFRMEEDERRGLRFASR